LSANATDVLAQLTLMVQFANQLGPSYALFGLVLSSGLQTTGEVVTNTDLSQTAALYLANRIPVPSLSGAHLTISGIGVVASGPPAPSGFVEALAAFYTKVCTRTGATACTITVNPIITGS